MSIPYLKYKRCELNLQERFGLVKVALESIDPTDVFYTDGDATRSDCKVIIRGINGLETVYIPQLIYNVTEEYKVILEEWLEYVKTQG
jgi:hypothetical protein